MNKKGFYLFLLIAFILFGCIYATNSKDNLKNYYKEINVKKLSTEKLIIGSSQYEEKISKVAIKEGYKKALYYIIDDVEKNNEKIDKKNTENNMKLYKLICSFISKLGYVDMRTHYFRNKLNIVPQSLEELLHLNSNLPAEKRWKLITAKNSFYHMQGNDGEYNLKFVSCDGYYEAVYNKKGILLTEKNDPVNMGSFNYCAGIKENNAHFNYDIVPYLKWGNTPNSPQKNKDDIYKGNELARKQYERNITKVQEYRESIMKIQNILIPNKATV